MFVENSNRLAVTDKAQRLALILSQSVKLFSNLFPVALSDLFSDYDYDLIMTNH